MAHEYLNPVVSSAAVCDGATSTYHTLSGQAQQILMVTTATGISFFYSFDSTNFSNTSGVQIQNGLDPLIIPVNNPSYVVVYSASTGWVHITEFV
jgi:hypothetical protein